ncbi:MAG: DUF3090 family protein [Acidimicrobiales bacterium]
MSEVFELDAPSRITFGAIGPVGQRLFVLQARQDESLITLKLEKQQVAAISQSLGQMLEDLPRLGHLPEDSELEVENFEEPDFVVGTLAIAYDPEDDRVVILSEEATGEDEVGETARIACTREQAGALAIRGVRLVEAGRPACPLCGYPLDPRGHTCPRTNGNRAPLT